MFGDKQFAPRVNSARAETVAEHQMMAGATPQQQQIRPNAVAELTKTTKTNVASLEYKHKTKQQTWLTPDFFYWTSKTPQCAPRALEHADAMLHVRVREAYKIAEWAGCMFVLPNSGKHVTVLIPTAEKQKVMQQAGT